MLSIDAQESEGRHADEPLDSLDPEAHVQRRWDLTILQRAMTRFWHEFAAAGPTIEFEQLEAYLTGTEPRVCQARAPPSVSARPRAPTTAGASHRPQLFVIALHIVRLGRRG